MIRLTHKPIQIAHTSDPTQTKAFGHRKETDVTIASGTETAGLRRRLVSDPVLVTERDKSLTPTKCPKITSARLVLVGPAGSISLPVQRSGLDLRAKSKCGVSDVRWKPIGVNHLDVQWQSNHRQ
jgi:hypothetical protein